MLIAYKIKQHELAFRHDFALMILFEGFFGGKVYLNPAGFIHVDHAFFNLIFDLVLVKHMPLRLIMPVEISINI